MFCKHLKTSVQTRKQKQSACWCGETAGSSKWCWEERQRLRFKWQQWDQEKERKRTVSPINRCTIQSVRHTLGLHVSVKQTHKQIRQVAKAHAYEIIITALFTMWLESRRLTCSTRRGGVSVSFYKPRPQTKEMLQNLTTNNTYLPKPGSNLKSRFQRNRIRLPVWWWWWERKGSTLYISSKEENIHEVHQAHLSRFTPLYLIRQQGRGFISCLKASVSKHVSCCTETLTSWEVQEIIIRGLCEIMVNAFF